jgi:hypothetical protein
MNIVNEHACRTRAPVALYAGSVFVYSLARRSWICGVRHAVMDGVGLAELAARMR